MEQLENNAVESYEIKEQIGKGGYSTVFCARQQSTGREVAIKVILPELTCKQEFIRRFEQEAQIVARLEHLHITPLYDYWQDSKGAYLVMRYIRGGSLASAIKAQPYDLEKASRLLDQIASALHAAHTHDIIHRDVKPSNILLDEDGNAFLSDFGIARDNKIEGDGLTQANMIIGSLDYLSPEQARNEPVTAQTDIYCLGVTLYEVITGLHPFEKFAILERLFKHIYEPLPQITSLDESVRDAVNEVIAKATAKKPSDRFSDVLAFAAAFREAIQEPLFQPKLRNQYDGQAGGRSDFFLRERLIEKPFGRRRTAEQPHHRLILSQESGLVSVSTTQIYHPNNSILKYGMEGIEKEWNGAYPLQMHRASHYTAIVRTGHNRPKNGQMTRRFHRLSEIHIS